MDPLAYCEDKLAHPDSDYPLVRVFLDAGERRRHAALQALRLELLNIPDGVADPGVARTKLQWWREELLRYAQGEARHPVTRLLSAYREQLAPEALLHMTLAVDDLLPEGATWSTFDELHAHCATISGAAAALEARLSGLDEDAGALAGQIGIAAHVTRLLANLPADAARGRAGVPMDEMARFQVSRSELGEGVRSEAIAALLELQMARASALHREALEGLSPSQRRRLLPWIIRARLDQAVLAPGPVSDLRLSLGPLRRLWIAWRTASHTKRAALAETAGSVPTASSRDQR